MVDARSRDGSLIPGLPEEIVFGRVIPRLPWYARPVCRSISKSWRTCMDSLGQRPGIDLETRKFQLPLLKGLFIVCTFDTQLFITGDPRCDENLRPEYYRVRNANNSYQMHRRWRKLPPLQGFLSSKPKLPRLIASSGMVYVWLDEEPHDVVKMDLGRGDWTWKELKLSHHFNKQCVDFNGKIYIPRSSATETGRHEEWVVMAHYMLSDECEQVETWNHENLRVVFCKSLQVAKHYDKGLYAFVEHESVHNPRLELLEYDSCSDSWRSQEDMSFPGYKWPELAEVKLLNADCFEPPLQTDANTAWADCENEVITWFDSRGTPKSWVCIDYSSSPKDMYMEYTQYIGGSLYAVFCKDREIVDDDDDEEGDGDEDDKEKNLEGQKDPMLNKSTIMKGRINLTSNSVEWEATVVIGCFEDARDSPVECFTVMG